ncbi:MAG: linked oxidase domain protein [Thermomicrobiales bacterium]|jgi:FAD/FMN-containing dehydrogenase|nr:linked oxidase domain protein [Thermomicrobiales bacterium]
MNVVSPTATSRTLNSGAIATLREAITGSVITPTDSDYEQARSVWNGMIDRYPALVARCATVGDVIAAVAFAAAHDLPVAVRGGGHSVAGHSTCDGGIVIDLSQMKRIDIDPKARIAHAGAGITWGELDAATQPYGLATPGGVFSRTGIAGLTLGGGYGWLSATYGLSCDNLIEAEVVTADGRVIVASEEENPELLWGLRGGGGNFGIVTRFTYRLHPVGPQSYLAVALHDGEDEATVRALRFFRDFCETAPDEVTLIAVCGVVPAHDEVYPKATHGRRYVMLGGHYVGPLKEGERLLRPLREFAEPLVDFSGDMPYVDVQMLWDEEYPDGDRYYWKSVNMSRFDEEAIARIAARAREQSSPLSTTDIWHVGGAFKQAQADRSAFRGRDAAFLLSAASHWGDPTDDARNVRWAREFVAAMEPYSDGSRYLNFAGFEEEGEAMMRSSFGPHYERLLALKRCYDPTNLFHLNQNIDPAGGRLLTEDRDRRPKPLADRGLV